MGSEAPERERSIALAMRAAAVLPGGVNSNFRLPAANRFYVSASGSRLIDADDHEVIDYVLGMGVAILGHSPKGVLDAVALAESRLQCPAGQQEAEVELAERIVALVPSAELVRIGCTGSEMVQLAMRLARAATGRSLIVKFEGHYHGWLDSIFAGTTAIDAERPDGRQVPSARAQTAGQMAGALGDLTVLPWNDLDTLQTFLDEHGDKVAGLIMEPICCNTSVIEPRPGYLEGVRRLADQHGIVLIFDEVITGFRFAPGGAQERLGVTPDLTVLGKALGAGYPVAALAGRRHLMRLIGDGTVMHGGTYNANAMAVAAAAAALDIIASPLVQLHRCLETMAARLAAGLAEAGSTHDHGLLVQRCGPMINTTFEAPAPITDLRSYLASDLGKQQRFIEQLEHEGVRVTARGTWFLSLEHSEDDIDRSVLAAGRALEHLKAAGEQS